MKVKEYPMKSNLFKNFDNTETVRYNNLKNIHTFDNSKRSDAIKSGFNDRNDAEKYMKFKNSMRNRFYDFEASVICIDD